MFAASLFDSILPAYGVIAITLVVLLGAAVVVASRVLMARRVACPKDGSSADILVESQKRWPWSHERRTSVAQCSHLPNGVTCAQQCLGAKTDSPPAA